MGAKRPLELSSNDVTRHFEANVLATFLPSRFAGLMMIAQSEGGNIITIGDWAQDRPYLGYSAYFATKVQFLRLREVWLLN